MPEPRVQTDRVCSELDRLAEFSDAAGPAVTRVMLSEADLAARQYLAGLYDQADLTVRTDAAGTVFARWRGEDDTLPAVATGSHCDAIPYSGKYDGTVGVLGGLEAIRTLQAEGWRPRRSIELVMFTSEEPTRYGVGCLGSRLMVGLLDPREADALTDERGVAFADLRAQAGFAGDLATTRLAAGAYHAFVELHIEQGPLLEQAGAAIGAVTAIAAPATLRVQYTGSGGHAGAVLMADRRDALLPAAGLTLAVRAAAVQHGGDDTVATAGCLKVHPNAVNSIPSRVTAEIDIRDIDLARRDRVLTEVRSRAATLGEEHGQATEIEVLNADPPAACSPEVIAAVEESAAALDHASQRMISRAYHDSLFMAQVAPTGMIFIPCRGGVSHRPEEYASPEAIHAGVQVLAETLRRLAGT
ncbi:MAG: M20 family metallo-hydrolase [Planctomycetota bacterium]